MGYTPHQVASISLTPLETKVSPKEIVLEGVKQLLRLLFGWYHYCTARHPSIDLQASHYLAVV